MSAKRQLVCIAGLALICAAAAVSSYVRPLRADHYTSAVETMHLVADGRSDLPRTLSPAPAALRPTATARLSAGRLLRFLDTVIPATGMVAPAPVWRRFELSFAPSPHTALPLRVPSGRAPPALSIS
jgi:hypothetical protein